MAKHGYPRPSFSTSPPDIDPAFGSTDRPVAPSSPAADAHPHPHPIPDTTLHLAAARIALGREFAILEADTGFAALIGLSGEALRGRSLFDFVFPSERQAVTDRLSYAVACRNDRIDGLALRRHDDRPVRIDAALRYDAADGEGLWLHCSRLTDAPAAAAEASTPATTTARDRAAPDANTAPERTPIEAAPPDDLDEAIRQVLRLEDVRGQAMLVIGAAGQVIAGTSAAATRVGWPIERLNAHTIDDLFVFSPPARQLLHEAVRTGRRQTVPASIVCGMALANLEWLPAMRAGFGFLSVLPVQTTAATDDHVIALQQAVRLMWHDAGEAVTALVLGTETLSQLLGADARRPGAAEIATDLMRHARTIHQALAEVRRVETGTPVELRPVDLNAVIEGYLAAIRPVAIAESVTIRAQLTPGVQVRSTDLRVRSIVRNLVTNARQALGRQPNGGVIEITTTLADSEDGPGVQLVVRDDGPGMSDALSRVIFEPGLSDRDGGTGIGLNLVRQFIVESGGAVQPLSRPGQGTAFVIWLPTVPAAVSPPDAAPDRKADPAPDPASPPPPAETAP